MTNKVKIHTDGGAKGNPGPAAIGAVINVSGEEKEYSKKLGETTNNVAEYKGAIFALQKLKQLIGKEKSKETEVILNMDSQLVVRQLKAEYKVKEEGLKNLFIDLWNLRQNFKKVSFNHVPREENEKADKLVKDLLNTLV